MTCPLCANNPGLNFCYNCSGLSQAAGINQQIAQQGLQNQQAALGAQGQGSMIGHQLMARHWFFDMIDGKNDVQIVQAHMDKLLKNQQEFEQAQQQLTDQFLELCKRFRPSIVDNNLIERLKNLKAFL